MNFHYYDLDGKLLASAIERPGLQPTEPRKDVPVFYLTDRDPVSGRGCFRADALSRSGQALPHQCACARGE